MSEYRSNSTRSREEAAKPEATPKHESVVTAPAAVRKKNAMEKLGDIFTKQDASRVKEYILGEIIIPKTKQLVDEMVMYVKDVLIYGEYRGGNKAQSGAARVSYRQYYQGSGSRPSAVQSTQDAISYDEILFKSCGDAQLVLTTMHDILDHYRNVKVSDMFDLANLPCEHTLNKYGWIDLKGAEVVAIKEGYVIKLPRPMPID